MLSCSISPLVGIGGCVSWKNKFYLLYFNVILSLPTRVMWNSLRDFRRVKVDLWNFLPTICIKARELSWAFWWLISWQKITLKLLLSLTCSFLRVWHKSCERKLFNYVRMQFKISGLSEWLPFSTILEKEELK